MRHDLLLDVTARESASGEFFAGDEIGHWQMFSPLKRGAPVVRLRSHDSVENHVDSPAAERWACLSGTIRQTLSTQPGMTYLLAYDACSLTIDAASGASSVSGPSVGDVLIDGVVVQTVVALASAPCAAHEVYFTAVSSRTVVSFTTAGRNSVALRNVHLSTADLAVLDLVLDH